MTDTSVSNQGSGGSSGSGRDATGAESRHWLVLTHHLPPEPAYLRVKVRRRLERIGAVPLKNSVYVLPPGEDTQEDFEWLCQEIARAGGETSLCLASFLDGTTDARLVSAFREARGAEYRAIAESATELATQWEGSDVDESTRTTGRSRLNRLREQLGGVTAIDYLEAPERTEAQGAIERAEAALHDPSPGALRQRNDGETRGRTWVTRMGVKVDRIASAWLIRRFIDREAVFKFVPARGYTPREGELRFDMFEGEFTHVGDACTFETLLQRFDLQDEALRAIGEIVHDIDCKDEKFGRAEVGGIASVIRGIATGADDDDRRLELGAAVMEALYETFNAGSP